MFRAVKVGVGGECAFWIRRAARTARMLSALDAISYLRGLVHWRTPIIAPNACSCNTYFSCHTTGGIPELSTSQLA